MPSIAELLLSVKGKDDGASKVLDDIDKKAGGIGSTLKSVGGIAAGFVLGEGLLKAPGFLSDAAKAAADDEASTNRLKNAITNTGSSWNKVKGQIDAVIASGQRLGFTDDETRDSLALLAAQTGNTSDAVKRYSLAQDLARGANIDVVTASRLLGKVTDENVNVLARYGIKVEKGASETQLFAAIYQKFHGQAQTFADSTAGKMARFQDQMSELKESIGYAVLPIMTAVADIALTKVVPALSAGADYAIKLGRAAIDYLRDPFNDVVEVVGKAVDILGHLEGAFQDPAVFIQEGIGITGAWGQMLTNVVTFIRDQMIPTLISMGQGIQTVGGQVVQIVTAIVQWVQNSGLLQTALVGLQTIWQGITAAAQALWPLLKQVADFIVENKVAAYALVAVLGALIVAMAPIPIAIAAIILAVGALREHWDEIKQKTQEVWDSIPGPIKTALAIVRTVVESILGDVEQIFEGTYRTISGIVDLVVDLFHGRWAAAWEDMKEIAAGLVESFIGGLRLAFGGVAGIVLDNLNKIPGIAYGIVGEMYSAGKAIVNGLWNGMKSEFTDMLNWVEGQVKSIADKAKGVLGIHSPSAVFQDIGKQVVNGLRLGLGGNADLGMIVPGLPTAAGAMPAAAGAGAGQIVVNINGPVYGLEDFDRRVRQAVRTGVDAGAFRGIL